MTGILRAPVAQLLQSPTRLWIVGSKVSSVTERGSRLFDLPQPFVSDAKAQPHRCRIVDDSDRPRNQERRGQERPKRGLSDA